MANAAKEICIVGLWHQGVVGAACLADLGYNVLAADSDKDRIQRLQKGQPPLFEPGLDNLLTKGLEGGRLQFTDDLASAVANRRYVLLMFDTPVDENDQSDLSPIYDAVTSIAPHLEADTVVLVTAQVPVGTCDRITGLIREINPSARFTIAYMPENLRLGQAINLFRKPPLPVIGTDDDATFDAVADLLSVLEGSWERVSLRTGEMTKHALNVFLATSISFGNELGNLCDEVGADGKRLAQVLRLEPRVGSKAMILPGLGFSGGTIARDMQSLRALGSQKELPTRFLDGVWEANQLQNGIVLRKLQKLFGSLKGRRIAVLGLTYKPDTSTLRRSASLEVIGGLESEGAIVHAHDPKADRDEVAACSGFTFCEDPYAAAESAEALVLMTGWSEYKALDAQRLKSSMARPVVLDPNGMLDGCALADAGFTYMAIGQGQLGPEVEGT